MFLWCERDGWRDIYSERGLLLPISSSVKPAGANACTPLQARQLRVSRSTAILCTLSKSDRVVLITSSPSVYTPVVPECPDHPAMYKSKCDSLSKHKMWQLVKAHVVTRNEPKIYVICYITRESSRSVRTLATNALDF